MLKKIFPITLILILVIGFSSLSYAYQAIALSDAELDNVSAAGFDIDISAVLALREALMSGQKNITSVVAQNGNINGIILNNSNTLTAPSAETGISEQNNVAVVAALDGSIENTSVNNANTANLNSAQDFTQRNIAILVAKANIENSGITNANFLNTGGESYSIPFNSWVTHNIRNLSINYSAGAKQRNLEVIVSFAGEIKNTYIHASNNRNTSP